MLRWSLPSLNAWIQPWRLMRWLREHLNVCLFDIMLRPISRVGKKRMNLPVCPSVKVLLIYPFFVRLLDGSRGQREIFGQNYRRMSTGSTYWYRLSVEPSRWIRGISFDIIPSSHTYGNCAISIWKARSSKSKWSNLLGINMTSCHISRSQLCLLSLVLMLSHCLVSWRPLSVQLHTPLPSCFLSLWLVSSQKRIFGVYKQSYVFLAMPC